MILASTFEAKCCINAFMWSLTCVETWMYIVEYSCGEKVDIHVQMSRPVSLAYCIDFLPFTLLLLIFISLFNPSSCNFVQSFFCHHEVA